MAKKEKKRKGKKRSPTSHMTNQGRRAELLIKTLGRKIAFIGGTVFENCSIHGIDDIVKAIQSPLERQRQKDLVSACLISNRRKWTVAFALIYEEGDELKLDTDYYWIDHSTTTVLSPVITHELGKEWVPFREKHGDAAVGNVWLATPCEINNADDVLESFDEFLEESRVFDVEYSRECLKNNMVERLKDHPDFKVEDQA